MMLMIGNRLPGASREPHGIWAVDICRSSNLQHPMAAGGIVAVAIHLRSPPGDLITAQEMASELTAVVGAEEQDPVEASEAYPIINRSTGTTIASSLLRLADSVLVDLDWSLSKLKALTIDKTHRSSPRPPLEEALYSRSAALVNLLSHFAQMKLKGETPLPPPFTPPHFIQNPLLQSFPHAEKMPLIYS